MEQNPKVLIYFCPRHALQFFSVLTYAGIVCAMDQALGQDRTSKTTGRIIRNGTIGYTSKISWQAATIFKIKQRHRRVGLNSALDLTQKLNLAQKSPCSCFRRTQIIHINKHTCKSASQETQSHSQCNATLSYAVLEKYTKKCPEYCPTYIR